MSKYLLILLIFFFSCAVNEENSTKEPCEIPLNIKVSNFGYDNNQGGTSATITWESNLEEVSFELKYELEGGNIYNNNIITTNQTEYQITGLVGNAEHIVSIRTICDDGIYSEWSEEIVFNAIGFYTYTCTQNPPSNIVIDQIGDNQALVKWDHSKVYQGFDIEYGLSGFTLGTGIEKFSSEPEIELSGLNVDTTYDVYLKTNCNSDISSEYSGPFTFDIVSFCTPLEISLVDTPDISRGIHRVLFGLNINENFRDKLSHFELEYGESNFTIGQGKVLTISSDHSIIDFNFDSYNLLPSTTYDFYFRSICKSGSVSENSSVISFTTFDLCIKPGYYFHSPVPNTIYMEGESSHNGKLELEYGLSGFKLGEGTTIFDVGYYLIRENVEAGDYDIYMRTYCGNDGYSEYRKYFVKVGD